MEPRYGNRIHGNEMLQPRYGVNSEAAVFDFSFSRTIYFLIEERVRVSFIKLMLKTITKL
jgi:hypothetical protein